MAETAIAITAQVFIRAVSFYANASEMVAGAIIIALVCKTKKGASLQVVLAMIVSAQFIIFSANLCELALNLLAVIVASGSRILHFGTTDLNQNAITARIA